MSPRPRTTSAGTVRDRWVSVAAVVFAVAPIAVSATRAVRRSWVPIGDNAYFSLRAGDVLTDHHPLLGTWTSASVTAGVDFNNPGPLLFDLFAIGQRIAPGGAGLAVAAALVNVAAVAGIAAFAHRRGGAPLVALAMLVTASIAWSMGSELLYDPWQPHSLVLPFMCFLVAVWSTSVGDLAAAPAVVGVGSLLVQTHLSYVFLVAGLAAWAAVGAALELLRRRRAGPGARAEHRRPLMVAALVTVGVGAACWAQPIVEQITGDGRGNLSRIVEATGGSDAARAGWGLGQRLVASVVALPPWWLRPSFADAFVADDLAGPAVTPPGLPSAAAAIASLVAVVALLVGAAWVTRRSDAVSSRAAVTAVVALVSGLVTASQVPVEPFGIAAHQFRWLWPLAAFAVLAVAGAIVRRATGRDSAVRLSARPVAVGLAAATLVVAGLTLPTSAGPAGPQLDAWAIPVVRDLNAQMQASPELRAAGRILAEEGGLAFAEPYSAPIIAQLQRMGVEFVVAGAGPVRQVGPSRRFTGRNAQAAITYRRGDAALTIPDGARLVAYHSGLSPAERDELGARQAQLIPHLAAGALRLNGRGREALRRGQVSTLGEAGATAARPEEVFRSRDLVAGVRRRLVDVPRDVRPTVERYADLQFRADRDTVAVLLTPIRAA